MQNIFLQYTENSLAVSYKTEHATAIQPSNCTSAHLSWRNENLKNLNMNVYSSCISNSWNRETVQVSSDSSMIKQWCSHTMEYYLAKRENCCTGHSLVFQWLGLWTFTAQVPFLVGELRSHRLYGKDQKRAGGGERREKYRYNSWMNPWRIKSKEVIYSINSIYITFCNDKLIEMENILLVSGRERSRCGYIRSPLGILVVMELFWCQWWWSHCQHPGYDAVV